MTRTARTLLLLWAVLSLVVPCLGCTPGAVSGTEATIAADTAGDDGGDGGVCGCAAPCATPGCTAAAVLAPAGLPDLPDRLIVGANSTVSPCTPTEVPSDHGPDPPFHPPRGRRA